MELPYYDVEDMIKEDIIDKNLYCNENKDNDGEEISELKYITNNTYMKNAGNTVLLSYSKSNATSYAKKYAENPNSHFGYISGHDCTNFASQVMAAGGKSYTTKWITAQVLGKWYYTSAWSNANSFANYWGVDYTYTSHKKFSSKLSKGDFITEDKIADGDWDHIGYVVNVKDSYNKNLGYTNYKVAQHTSNYLAWASSARCGWDELKDSYPNCKFGIIRVN